jgi:GNAT superfamily N-acetyltransferase
VKVETLTQEDLLPLASRAAREGVSLRPTSWPTDWYGIRVAGELVAVAGLLRMPNMARLRGDYTRPEHRGKGYHTKLTLWRLKAAQRHGGRLEVITAEPAYYAQFGFVAVGPRGRFWRCVASVQP